MLNVKLEPIQPQNLKDIFIEKMERMIIAGEIQRGERLPSERELATMLGVSRPVVHEGLVEMQRRGFVELTPRLGAVVTDYRRSGSLSMLQSLLRHEEGAVSADLLDSLLDMRFLIEVEIAGLAALNRCDDELQELRNIHAERNGLARHGRQAAEFDFRFHHQLAICTGNLVYPMFMNSFKPIYLNLAGKFYEIPDASETVAVFHQQLLTAIEARDSQAAVRVMSEALANGRAALKDRLNQSKGQEHERRNG